MIPQLRILSNVVERLRSLNMSTTGGLYGLMYNNTLTIMTFSTAVTDENESTLDHTAIQLSMPTEIDLCGVLYIGECEEKLPDAFQDIDITDNPLLLKYIPGSHESDVQAFFYIHQKLEKVKSIEIISEEDIYREFTYIRLQASFPLISKNWNVKDILLESRKSIASGKVGIWFPENNTYLFNSDDNTKSICLKELLSMSQTPEGHSNRSNRGKPVDGFAGAIASKMFFKVSTDTHSEECNKYAPALKHIKCTFNSMECKLKIDALSLVSHDITPSELYDILVESICRNIKLIEKYCDDQLKDVEVPKYLPEPLHYKPRGCGHLFTVVHPNNDSNAVEYRRSFHKALALDIKRPYFRRGNQVKFYNEIKPNEPLINPHVALFTNGDGEKTSIVHELYSYHHYMQDNFDDNGWGCAYRSLQTIISWYRLQGYTDIPIPTHRKIQECLVDIGDKPSSFIGSKQWIGSTEVGFVLETLLGVSIKILCASSGEEMATLSSNLAYHFQTQGTPVMIGGGVLAHTILGISQNESTGQVKFLILDPHYTGPENLSTIINKGWCGWKTKDFWKKDAFYNMCLPQRPICI